MGELKTVMKRNKRLFKAPLRIKESSCTIISDKKIGFDLARDSIIKNRMELEKYCKENSLFLTSLEPIHVTNCPLIVELMAKYSAEADVGPMASVAGVLADLAVLEMKKSGCEIAVVENGGEVAAFSNVPIDVCLSAGDVSLSNRFGFRLIDFPIGVATSSGRFSHALSFGEAEAVTIFCETAGLADAAATAVCNVVKGKQSSDTIELGIKKAKSIQGVLGVLIIYNELIGTAGQIPKIIKINPEC
jgi:ApbE superfamily uncharacterized protein (UPF0280 family)